MIGGRQLLQRPGFEGIQALIRRAMTFDQDAFRSVCQKLDRDADERDHFLENAKASVAVALLASLDAHEGRATSGCDVTRVRLVVRGFSGPRAQEDSAANVAGFARQFESELRTLVGQGTVVNVYVSDDPKRDVAEGALSIPTDVALRRTYGILTVDQDGPAEKKLAKITRRAAFPIGIPCRNQAEHVSWSEVISPGTQIRLSLHDHLTTIDMEASRVQVGRTHEGGSSSRPTLPQR
jgi:hypothetical protein